MLKPGIVLKTLSLIGLMVCAVSFIGAQDVEQLGAIRGHVFSSETGEEIIYATVIIEGTNIGTNSDENGFFNLTDIPVGEHSLIVSYVGFEESQKGNKLRQR